MQTIPLPHSAEELETLVGVTRNIAYFPRMSKSEQDDLLRVLEAYECLMQVVKLLDWRIRHGSTGDTQILSDYLWLMRVYYFGLEDFDGFLDTAARCIEHLHIPFAIVRLHVAEEILGVENFHEHAKLYARISGSFQTSGQKTLLLERLALIYEKKLFLEADVESAYGKLLELDPGNIKALRFYKLYYIQNNQWREAGRQLERLVEAARNPYEKQRAAHELAQIHLYNLNEPQRAREILEQFCENSALDTHQTLIEALERLEAYDELLSVLEKVDRLAQDPVEKAAVKLRIGLVGFKAGKISVAVSAARACLELQPSSLLAYEALIAALLEEGQIEAVVDALEGLGKVTRLEPSRDEVGRLLDRAKKVQQCESRHV